MATCSPSEWSPTRLAAVLAQRSLPLALELVPATIAWRIALVVGGSLLIALAAQVAIPLPFVPITGQTYAVLVVAAALGRLGAASVALYVLEGAAGLPVFAPGGAPGLARLIGPTGGYLIGFVAAAFVVGWFVERGWDRRLFATLAAMLAAEVAIYAFGLAWLARFVPAERVLAAGLVPFVLGDLVKVLLAATTVRAARSVHGLMRK